MAIGAPDTRPLLTFAPAARIGRAMASIDRTQPTPEELVAKLCFLLELEERGPDHFLGRQQPEGTGRVFGGQAIAQALGAARRTVPIERHTHSLHAYFLRPGTDDLPIEYRVKRDLDGRSFSNRRVVASQAGEPILNLVASFQKPQEGFMHQAVEMPDIPAPEKLRPDAEALADLAPHLKSETARQLALRPRPIDMRSVEPRQWINPEKMPARAHTWFRTVAPLPDHPPVHRAVLAYLSDFQMLSTAVRPHGLGIFDGTLRAASLDHALWFHSDFRADEWLLFTTESPWAGLARGYVRGQIFTRDGRLVASVTQEGMLREIKRET